MNRRTWAPHGETPQQRAWDRYDRLSVIGATTVSPTRCRIGLPFQIHGDNIRTAEVVEFVQQLRRSLRKPLIIVWDRWSVHRAAAKRFSNFSKADIEFEWLPAYAPELNPVEAWWSHTKYADLANFVPEDTDVLTEAVEDSLQDQATKHQLKHSFFKTAKLSI